MKCVRFVVPSLLFALAFVLPLKSSAQIWDKAEAGFGAGFTAPIGRTSNDVDMGWNIGARAGYNVNPYLSADLDFSYNYWGLNSAALAHFKEPGGSMGIWSLTFNPVIRALPKKRFDPYVTAGFGLYHRNLTLTTPTLVTTVFCDYFFGSCFPATVGLNQVVASASTYKAGYNAGGGIEVRLGGGRLRVFGEARYENMFTTHGKDMTYVPVTFGVRW